MWSWYWFDFRNQDIFLNWILEALSLGTKAEAPTVLPCSTVASMTKESLIMGVYIDIFDLRENISRYLFTYYIQSHGYVIRSLRVAKFPDSIVLKFQFMNPFHKINKNIYKQNSQNIFPFFCYSLRVYPWLLFVNWFHVNILMNLLLFVFISLDLLMPLPPLWLAF